MADGDRATAWRRFAAATVVQTADAHLRMPTDPRRRAARCHPFPRVHALAARDRVEESGSIVCTAAASGLINKGQALMKVNGKKRHSFSFAVRRPRSSSQAQ